MGWGEGGGTLAVTPAGYIGNISDKHVALTLLLYHLANHGNGSIKPRVMSDQYLVVYWEQMPGSYQAIKYCTAESRVYEGIAVRNRHYNTLG